LSKASFKNSFSNRSEEVSSFMFVIEDEKSIHVCRLGHDASENAVVEVVDVWHVEKIKPLCEAVWLSHRATDHNPNLPRKNFRACFIARTASFASATVASRPG
jgi:hypothetical protein